jgi:hypothetical protein
VLASVGLPARLADVELLLVDPRLAVDRCQVGFTIIAPTMPAPVWSMTGSVAQRVHEHARIDPVER